MWCYDRETSLDEYGELQDHEDIHTRRMFELLPQPGYESRVGLLPSGQVGFLGGDDAVHGGDAARWPRPFPRQDISWPPDVPEIPTSIFFNAVMAAVEEVTSRAQ
jgi:hypothetical protein